MLYANLQGLQAETQQLLLHAGQRELPVLPSALSALLCSLSQRRASVRGPLHPHSEPPEDLCLPPLSQLQQFAQTRYVLHSAVRQVDL